MKTMQSSILFAFIFSSFNVAFCQQQQGQAPAIKAVPIQGSGLISNNDRYQSKQSKGYISYEEVLAEYESFDGSPFLYGKEIIVDLIQADGGMNPGVRILYDLYNFEIIVKQNKEEDVILDKKHYIGFSYLHNGQVETYERVFDGQIKYFKVLFKNDDFSFLSNKTIRINDDTPRIPGKEDWKRKFISVENYFITTKKTIDEVSLKNERLVAYLPAKYKSKVDRLKKKLGIKKLKKEKDYILLMNEFQ